MHSDAQLVEQVLRDGPRAFGVIVERYQDAVFGIALARLRNFHDAQDVAQTVFVQAFEQLSTLRDPARLGAWLRTMTIGRSIDLLRRRHATAVEADHNIIDPRPSDELNRLELRDEVMGAIAKLSKPQRETVTLFYINGYSVDEVAALCEVSPGTIKSRLHDARAKLKEEMLHMVENVLKSEAPDEDFAGRVFELLTQPHDWWQRMNGTREIGIKGLDGFARALASPNSHMRKTAMHFILSNDEMRADEHVIDMLKRALADRNKKVRRAAVGTLIQMNVPIERKRGEFLPMIVPLLSDVSGRVRRNTAFYLIPFAGDVPLHLATAALLAEPNPHKAWPLRALVNAILTENRSDPEPRRVPGA